MSPPYLQAIEISNYRSFKKIRYERLARLNIVGGRNGVGKSALIEATFLLMDRRNPLALFRASSWRGMPPNPQAMEKQLSEVFHLGKIDKAIRFDARTRFGHEVVAYSYGSRSRDSVIVQPVTPGSGQGAIGTANITPASTSIGAQRAVTMESTLNENLEEKIHVSATGVGYSQAVENATSRVLPNGVLINASNRYSNADHTERFSTIVQANQKPQLIEIVRVLAPDLVDLQILQLGTQPIIHCRSAKGPWLPSPLFGDGAHLLMSIALAIMVSENGAVALDEFDTAIHYSALEKVWKILYELAQELNCQIFATTHSRECISAAVTGLRAAGALNELQYTRLDRIEGRVTCTSYLADELTASVDAEWEMR